jgi:acyl dehydratase
VVRSAQRYTVALFHCGSTAFGLPVAVCHRFIEAVELDGGIIDEPYFEELEIGTRSAAGPYSVSRDEIIEFAQKYDPVPRHIDEDAAARSVFGGLTACSAHTFSIFVLLTTRLHPRLHVLAGLSWDKLRLPHPVRPGDVLDLETTVLEMRESKSKSDRGIVGTGVLLRNQRREPVLECTSNIFVARRSETNAPTPS